MQVSAQLAEIFRQKNCLMLRKLPGRTRPPGFTQERGMRFGGQTHPVRAVDAVGSANSLPRPGELLAAAYSIWGRLPIGIPADFKFPVKTRLDQLAERRREENPVVPVRVAQQLREERFTFPFRKLVRFSHLLLAERPRQSAPPHHGVQPSGIRRQKIQGRRSASVLLAEAHEDLPNQCGKTFARLTHQRMRQRENRPSAKPGRAR